MIPVTKPSMPSFEEYCREIADIFESRWLTHKGPKYQEFEKKLMAYLESMYVSLFVNGHQALEGVLNCLDLKENGCEVITTPFTFASTTHAIIRSGLTPVFCDIDPSSFTLNPALIESRITEKTVAIVPVHVYGTICDVEAIRDIADEYDLKVVYDAAHAFGEKYKGEAVGNCGDATMFSLHATKVFNAIEGGVITTSNKHLLDRLEAWKYYGQDLNGDVTSLGTNAKMHEFSAAMGICNLRYVESELRKRRLLEQRYRDNLKGYEGFQTKIVQGNVFSNGAYFPVVINERTVGFSRDDVMEALLHEGIQARKYFCPPTSDFACFGGKFFHHLTPVAHTIAGRVLTLPLYADLTIEQVDRICEILVNC